MTCADTQLQGDFVAGLHCFLTCWTISIAGNRDTRASFRGWKELALQLEFTPTAARPDTTVLTQGQQGYQPQQQQQAQHEESKGHWPPYGRWGRDSWDKQKTYSASKTTAFLTTRWNYLLSDNTSSPLYLLQSIFFSYCSICYHCHEYPGVILRKYLFIHWEYLLTEILVF